MTRKFLLLSISISFLLANAWAADLPMPGFYSIHEINKALPGSTYTTQGYVVFKYEPNAQCKSCIEENIIISEKNTILEDYNRLSDNELVVYTDKANELELGKKSLLSQLRHPEPRASLEQRRRI